MIEREEAVVRTAAAIDDARDEAAIAGGELDADRALDRGDARERERRPPAIAVRARAEAAVLRIGLPRVRDDLMEDRDDLVVDAVVVGGGAVAGRRGAVVARVIAVHAGS